MCIETLVANRRNIGIRMQSSSMVDILRRPVARFPRLRSGLSCQSMARLGLLMRKEIGQGDVDSFVCFE